MQGVARAVAIEKITRLKFLAQVSAKGMQPAGASEGFLRVRGARPE